MPSSYTLLSYRTLLVVCLAVGFAADAGSIHDDAPYQTPQFTPDVTHRTDLCERQRQFRSGEIEFLDVLRGLELSVALPYIPGLGYINWDEEAGAFANGPGYLVELLDELAYRAGFSWRNSYGLILPVQVQGQEDQLRPNATANDLIMWAVNTYDFCFYEIVRSIQRMEMGIDFPAGFSDSSTILIARSTIEEESSFDAFSFLYPFDWSVWISIAATVIFTGLVYRLVSRTYYVGQSTLQPRDEHASEHVQGSNVFYAALTATGHMEFSPVTYGERILVLSLCFWSLVIAATYTANLASVMIHKSQPIYPATSVTEAQQKGVPICVAKGFAVADLLKEDYPSVKLIESEGLTAMYEDLRNNQCGLVADIAYRFEINKANETLNPDCSLEWVGRAVDISSAGPANVVDAGIYCTSLVGHVFEYYLKEMQRDHFIDNAFERYVNSVSARRCPEPEEASSNEADAFRLSMLDMGGIFLCHAVACVLGLLVSFVQRSWGQAHKTRNAVVHREEDTESGTVQRDESVNYGNPIISSRKIGSGAY